MMFFIPSSTFKGKCLSGFLAFYGKLIGVSSQKGFFNIFFALLGEPKMFSSVHSYATSHTSSTSEGQKREMTQLFVIILIASHYETPAASIFLEMIQLSFLFNLVPANISSNSKYNVN